MPQSAPIHGRGALANPPNRYHAHHRESVEEDEYAIAEPSPKTRLDVDHSRRIISRNDSPDIRFDRSINPYRGCEHGCVYCYARPTHAWMDLSPGLDFETRLFHKPNAVEQLRSELSRRGYRPQPIALSGITDPYQPVERGLGLTRGLLRLLTDCRHPFLIITKSSLVARDRDLLARAAADRLVEVGLSLTTLDKALARRMEPRASSPASRLAAIEALAEAGIPVRVMLGPVIPALNDAELERILRAARSAGAGSASYILLRLPQEVSPLFRQWLLTHYPDKAARVMAQVRDCRGGKDYRSGFGERMRGRGPIADLIAQRFRLASKQLGYGETAGLRCDLFRPPPADDRQMTLF